MKNIVFIGANNPETQRMIAALKNSNAGSTINFLGFVDNDPLKKNIMFCGLPVFGGYEILSDLNYHTTKFINLITRDCHTRYETSKRVADAGFEFTNFIHPSIDLTCVKIGQGNYIQESVVLQADTIINDNSSIHMGALISHESVIGSSVFVAHGVVMSGCVIVEDGVFIGAGAVIVPRVRIGAWSMVGAGSVVTKDIPPGSVAVGNPARVIKRKLLPEHGGCPWK